MNADEMQLKTTLKKAGLSDTAIDAAWPTWWSEDAFSSRSARAELRFSLARKLGLSPKSLFHDQVEFVWRDEARFKRLSSGSIAQQSALTSFGISISRLLLRASRSAHDPRNVSALDLRSEIVKSAPFVDLGGLLATCWAIGVPVIHLRVFPLAAKRMHAMAVGSADRFAILLGRSAQYPAPSAFDLAHELGHVALGHVAGSSAIVDIGDPIEEAPADEEEDAADRYALSLLLGTPNPVIQTSITNFNSAQLAHAVLQEGPARGIEPGTLALSEAYASKSWARAMAAMPYIYDQPKDVSTEVNRIAENQLDWGSLSDEATDYLRKVMGLGDA